MPPSLNDVNEYKFVANYKIFSKFYDEMTGSRTETARKLLTLVYKANPKAKTVLELGCGTGWTLKYLSRDYDVWGLDLSKSMLSIARKKAPQATLVHQNMTTFQLAQQFDVICCFGDSINHILNFSDWKRLFSNACRHLVCGGIFIFDMNTEAWINQFAREAPRVLPFGNNFSIMEGTRLNRITNCNFKIFEHIGSNRYLLHEDNLSEVSFPLPKVVRALTARFSKVKVVNIDGTAPSPEAARVYLICEKSC